MLASEAFKKITHKSFLYNIQPIVNIPSVIQHGILCYNEVKKLPHSSIALNTVQDRRSKVTVPNGLRLHDYANLYFDFHNPMLSRRRDQAEEICILSVDRAVLDVEGCVLTDRNAAALMVKFLDPVEGLSEIEFDKVYADFWLHRDDEYEERNHKAIKCAEVLIPKCVPFQFVTAACVVSDIAKAELLSAGFPKEIVVKPERFF